MKQIVTQKFRPDGRSQRAVNTKTVCSRHLGSLDKNERVLNLRDVSYGRCEPCQREKR